MATLCAISAYLVVRGGVSMNHKDMIYKHAFDELTKKGATQKIAGDYAARAVFLWSRGRTLEQALKISFSEAKPSLRHVANKKARRAEARTA